jgi:hypothetical protein
LASKTIESQRAESLMQVTQIPVGKMVASVLRAFSDAKSPRAQRLRWSKETRDQAGQARGAKPRKITVKGE